MISLGKILVCEFEDSTRYELIKVKGMKVKSFLEMPKKIEGAGP